MIKYPYTFWDLDGTLTDSGPGIFNAVKIALADQGIIEENPDNLRRFVGPPLDYSFTTFYGMSHEQALTAIQKYREYYGPIGLYENEVYPGIPELLKHLSDSGIFLAVASSKPLVMVHQVLEHFGLDSYFKVVVGCGLDGTLSSKIEVLDETLRQSAEMLGITREELTAKGVMIGDRFYDMDGAHHFGLTPIGVTYGYGSSGELNDAGAACLAADAAELERILLG